MNLKYINKIKANISIYSSKKSTNILDGTYKSKKKKKSTNFENLREYVINDDVKDIDWKSSARSGTLLVKQFIAEKKHNILLVLDNGIKFSADTSSHESKKELALYTAGTIGYLAIKNNDYVGMIFSNDKNIVYKQFKFNLYNLEQYLTEYDKSSFNDGPTIEEKLQFINKNIPKKTIIFIISDIDGITSINVSTLKKLKYNHDILIINIDDNYLSGTDIYDVNKKTYIPSFILKNKKLNNIEKELRKNIIKENKEKLKINNINMITINSIKEINKSIIQLLEEHKYGAKN